MIELETTGTIAGVSFYNKHLYDDFLEVDNAICEYTKMGVLEFKINGRVFNTGDVYYVALRVYGDASYSGADVNGNPLHDKLGIGFEKIEDAIQHCQLCNNNYYPYIHRGKQFATFGNALDTHISVNAIMIKL